jgi:hypothetical protein
MREWRKDDLLLKIALDIFDENGKLKLFTPEEWTEGLVNSRTISHLAYGNIFVQPRFNNQSAVMADLDDDLPF